MCAKRVWIVKVTAQNKSFERLATNLNSASLLEFTSCCRSELLRQSLPVALNDYKNEQLIGSIVACCLPQHAAKTTRVQRRPRMQPKALRELQAPD